MSYFGSKIWASMNFLKILHERVKKYIKIILMIFSKKNPCSEQMGHFGFENIATS